MHDQTVSRCVSDGQLVIKYVLVDACLRHSIGILGCNHVTAPSASSNRLHQPYSNLDAKTGQQQFSEVRRHRSSEDNFMEWSVRATVEWGSSGMMTTSLLVMACRRREPLQSPHAAYFRIESLHQARLRTRKKDSVAVANTKSADQIILVLVISWKYNPDIGLRHYFWLWRAR